MDAPSAAHSLAGATSVGVVPSTVAWLSQPAQQRSQHTGQQPAAGHGRQGWQQERSHTALLLQSHTVGREGPELDREAHPCLLKEGLQTVQRCDKHCCQLGSVGLASQPGKCGANQPARQVWG